MIDKLLHATRVAHSLIERCEAGDGLTVESAEAIFLHEAGHKLTDEDCSLIAATAPFLEENDCKISSIFYLSHYVYHILFADEHVH